MSPELRLDLGRGALIVATPETPSTGTVVAGGAECPRTGEGWTLPRPVPTARHHDGYGMRAVPVVHPTDPLLVFGEDGALLPVNVPLQAGPVWVVHLEEPPAESFEGGHQVIDVCGPPLGWHRWWLGRIWLDEGASIRSAGYRGAERCFGPWRTVGVAGAAVLDIGPPIHGLVDADGRSVHARLPRLHLPAGARWNVELRGAGSGMSRRVNPGVLDLAELLPRPALGRFSLNVSAPGQRAKSWTVTVAEGVRVTPDRQLRVFEPEGGVSSAYFTLSAPIGIDVPAAVVRLHEHETSRAVELRTATQSLAVRLEVPHCALRTRMGGVEGVGGTNQPWDTVPALLSLADLDAETYLDLRLPAAMTKALRKVPELLASNADGTVMQQVRGQRVTREVYRYRLSQLADTVRTAGSVQLHLPIGEYDRALVAFLRRPPVASGAHVDGAQLRLVNRVGGPAAVRVYAASAPWLPPQIVELPAGADTLQLDERMAAGPLVVVAARAGDPLPDGWPHAVELPRAVQVLDIVNPRRPQRPATAAESAMAAYLSGAAAVPRESDALALLVTVAASAPRLYGPGLGGLVAQECAAHLADHPVAALLAAGHTDLGAAEMVGPLIRSGLLARRLRAVDAPDAVTAICPAAPLPAILLASPLLPYLTGSPAWDYAELDVEEIALLDALNDVVPWATEILTSPVAASCDVTESGVWEAAGDVSVDLASLARGMRESPNHDLLESVLGTARRPPPALLALGCALVARLAAQGDRHAGALEPRMRHTWLRLADLASARITEDVVLAEMLVSRHHARA